MTMDAGKLKDNFELVGANGVDRRRIFPRRPFRACAAVVAEVMTEAAAEPVA